MSFLDKLHFFPISCPVYFATFAAFRAIFVYMKFKLNFTKNAIIDLIMEILQMILDS